MNDALNYAILAFSVSLIWLVTGYSYYSNEENGKSSFMMRVLVPGLPVLVVSVIILLIKFA